MLIGNTIKETIQSFSKTHFDQNITYSASTSSKSARPPATRTESVARIIISIVLLGIAIYLLILDNKSQAALGIIGTVAGYWLK
jgi:hypothetical protein